MAEPTSPRKPFAPEVRARALRLVLKHQTAYATPPASIDSVAAKIGCPVEALRTGVRRAQRDTGRRPWPTTGERARREAFESEMRERQRPNDISHQGAPPERAGVDGDVARASAAG